MALTVAGVAGAIRRRASPGWQLAACGSMHVVNDGLFAGLYPLLPLVAADLGLSYAQAGSIKTVFTGSAAVFQVPAGLAAERLGEHLLLALGTGWVGVGLLAMAFAAGFWSLLAITLAAGLGGNVQHPVATSVVSRLFESGRRATAIGTLNFAGDIGKVLAPLVAGAAALVYGWRGGFLALGGIGAAFALLYLLAVPSPAAPNQVRSPKSEVRSPSAPAIDLGLQTLDVGPRRGQPAVTSPAVSGWGIRRPGLFAVLTGIGILDSAARGAALTFIPFLLQSKGLDAPSLSFYFTVLFGAGAAGKFICGPLADRLGNVATIAGTELVTAGALLALLGTPAGWVLLALLPLGFVLNGTSSVLYAAVADLVDASKRARGYGLYYTCSQLASALAPILYGLLADRAGLPITFVTMAAVTALIAPLTLSAARGLALTGGPSPPCRGAAAPS